ncbi:hypothetical protein Lalb_Chr20g0120191 [Lupinus albus]|uniref:Uncharacterized protein n=1 Tax=Lupinus albus TaxID=3870 RepID=A0A6A4NRJ9_LUPAL|nr:hypothetical protein Lalb_Chr20g0120191 [Lupinus albus]
MHVCSFMHATNSASMVDVANTNCLPSFSTKNKGGWRIKQCLNFHSITIVLDSYKSKTIKGDLLRLERVYHHSFQN